MQSGSLFDVHVPPHPEFQFETSMQTICCTCERSLSQMTMQIVGLRLLVMLGFMRGILNIVSRTLPQWLPVTIQANRLCPRRGTPDVEGPHKVSDAVNDCELLSVLIRITKGSHIC